MTHRGIRQEFGLLAGAARATRGETHRQLIEEQLALCLDVLRSHHREEDNWLFPTLRSRAPEALPGMVGLQADHQAIDALVTTVGETDRPLMDRAHQMQQLHELLNEHLEREERDVVPLILQHLSVEEWEQSSRRMLGGISKEKMPLVFGWFASASSPQQIKESLGFLTPPARLLFRLIWKPAYQQRYAALYR